MHRNNYEGMKKLLNDLIDTDYENYIKAIISIEKEINDPDILEYLYTKYMKQDFNLINDEFDELINELK